MENQKIELLLTELLIKVKVMDYLLVSKNVFVKDEFLTETNKLTEIISKALKEDPKCDLNVIIKNYFDK